MEDRQVNEPAFYEHAHSAPNGLLGVQTVDVASIWSRLLPAVRLLWEWQPSLIDGMTAVWEATRAQLTPVPSVTAPSHRRRLKAAPLANFRLLAAEPRNGPPIIGCIPTRMSYSVTTTRNLEAYARGGRKTSLNTHHVRRARPGRRLALHEPVEERAYTVYDLKRSLRPEALAAAVAEYDLKHGLPYRQASRCLAQAFRILYEVPDLAMPAPIDEAFLAASVEVGRTGQGRGIVRRPLVQRPLPSRCAAARRLLADLAPCDRFELLPLLSLVDQTIATVDAMAERIVAEYEPLALAAAARVARERGVAYRGIRVRPVTAAWESVLRIGWQTSSRPRQCGDSWADASEVQYIKHRRVSKHDVVDRVFTPEEAFEAQRPLGRRDIPRSVPRIEAAYACYYHSNRVAPVNRLSLLLNALRRNIAELRHIPIGG
jgi:hypothetical protein